MRWCSWSAATSGNTKLGKPALDQGGEPQAQVLNVPLLASLLALGLCPGCILSIGHIICKWHHFTSSVLLPGWNVLLNCERRPCLSGERYTEISAYHAEVKVALIAPPNLHSDPTQRGHGPQKAAHKTGLPLDWKWFSTPALDPGIFCILADVKRLNLVVICGVFILSCAWCLYWDDISSYMCC